MLWTQRRQHLLHLDDLSAGDLQGVLQTALDLKVCMPEGFYLLICSSSRSFPYTRMHLSSTAQSYRQFSSRCDSRKLAASSTEVAVITWSGGKGAAAW